MEKPSPLDIPEILSLIASFVPIWEVKFRLYVKFIPHDLLSCTLVSTTWRRVMLPHLWAVYSSEKMRIPIEVLALNSPLFRHIDLQERCWTDFDLLWKKSALQNVLRCSALKSFLVTPELLTEQLDLFRTNHSLVSLDWSSSGSLTRPAKIALEPFTQSLKEFRLIRDDCITVPELVSLLNTLPGLEHIQLGRCHNPLFGISVTELAGPGAMIQSLKRLTIVENTHGWNNVGPLLSLFRNCPRIEHVVLDITNSTGPAQRRPIKLPPLSAIHKSVLSWKSQGAGTIVDDVVDTQGKAALVLSQEESDRVLETLDIYVSFPGYDTTRGHMQFQRGCQDLVALTMDNVGYNDPKEVVPLIDSFRHTLRHVDLKCDSTMYGCTAFEILVRVLASLPEMLRLKFIAEAGLSKEESVDIFRGQFRPESKGGGSSVASVASKGDTAGWACQRLERLSIWGLWGTMTKDRPDVGDAVTLKAASEKHHWVACDPTNYGKRFRGIISERMQMLPALNELKLNNVYFEYSEIHSEQRTISVSNPYLQK